jgi:hypothetical protein
MGMDCEMRERMHGEKRRKGSFDGRYQVGQVKLRRGFFNRETREIRERGWEGQQSFGMFIRVKNDSLPVLRLLLFWCPFPFPTTLKMGKGFFNRETREIRERG